MTSIEHNCLEYYKAKRAKESAQFALQCGFYGERWPGNHTRDSLVAAIQQHTRNQSLFHRRALAACETYIREERELKKGVNP